MEEGGLEEERQRSQEKGKAAKESMPPGGVARKTKNGVTVYGMMKAEKNKRQTRRKDAVRKYITQHVPGTRLTFEQRQTLATDWNDLVRTGRSITIRRFAARHGINSETWRREYHRGATGLAISDPKDRRRRKYCEYDPFVAQDIINANNENKGARMLVTNKMASLQEACHRGKTLSL